MKIAILAAEESGDILGGDLLYSLKKRFPDASIEGIGGARMLAQGLKSFYPMERLSVMGIIEPLKRIREILGVRKRLINHLLQSKPDVFIGIDFTEFNLSLEKKLKSHNIKTVHCVSPTVWAWRKGRIKTIKKSGRSYANALSF